MDFGERVKELQRKFPDRTVAAILGVNEADVDSYAADPAHPPPVPTTPKMDVRNLGDFDLAVGFQETDALFYRLDGRTFLQTDFPPDVDGTVESPSGFLAVTCAARCTQFDTDLGEADPQSIGFGVFVRAVPDGEWGIAAGDLASGPNGVKKTDMNIGQVKQVPALEYCVVLSNSGGADRDVTLRGLALQFLVL